jgi:hypothetical protein
MVDFLCLRRPAKLSSRLVANKSKEMAYDEALTTLDVVQQLIANVR